MKIVKNLFLAFFLTFVCVSNIKAGPPEPKFAKNAVATTSESAPEIPAPIDQNMIFLLIFASSFGIYTIYRYNLKRKASM